jgi:glycosyltransferase involved in cell wall biosynthesis
MNPLVSICIPVYNGERYLQEALDSISTQSYTVLEVIVSDDESIDSSLELIERFRESVIFPVFIHHHKPKGIGANWNNTIKNAKGKYIKFLFQDDVLLPDCIEKMVCKMEAEPTLGMVACQREFIIEGNLNNAIKIWIKNYNNLQVEYSGSSYAKEQFFLLDKSIFSLKTFYSSIIKNKIGEPPTVMFKKSLVEEVGYFKEDLKQILDYEFYYRVLKKYPIMVLKEKLVKFRIHDTQATNVNRNTQINDYEKYNQLLYKDYLRLLHPEVQRTLKKKYSVLYRYFYKIRKKLKLSF